MQIEAKKKMDYLFIYLFYLNISMVNLFIIEATHHPYTFHVGRYEEQIRFLFPPCSKS